MKQTVAGRQGDLPHSVLLYGSHPDLDNDDCWTGADFATLAEAQAVLADPWSRFDKAYHNTSTACFVLDSADLPDLVVVDNPGFKPTSDEDFEREWRRELAMEAGMLHGCDAYNEVMGWDVEVDR